MQQITLTFAQVCAITSLGAKPNHGSEITIQTRYVDGDPQAEVTFAKNEHTFRTYTITRDGQSKENS